MLDHSVHVADLLRWFWGGEFTEVYAEIGCGLLHEGVSIDDAGLLSFALSNGAYGTLDTSWSRPPSYPTWGDVKLEIVGENGVARVDAFRQHLTLTSNEGSGTTRYLSWGSNADLGLVKSFVGMIREGYGPAHQRGGRLKGASGRAGRLPLGGDERARHALAPWGFYVTLERLA